MQHSPEEALTWDDVCGVPNNDMHERLRKHAHAEDMGQLDGLRAAYEARLNGEGDDATPLKVREAFEIYQRALLAMAKQYPAAEPVKSRDQIDITPRRIGSVPIIIANSYSLGLRALLAGARYGTTGVVMQTADPVMMEQKLRAYKGRMREAHPQYREPCVLTPDSTVAEYWNYIQRYEDPVAIVVDGNRDHFDRNADFLGVVGPNEIAKAKGRKGTPIRQLIKGRGRVLTANDGITPRQAVDMMDERDVSFLPVMDGSRVKGVMSRGSAGYHLRFQPHMDTVNGGLAYLTAISPGKTPIAEVQRWIEEQLVGVGIVIDTAHLDRGTKIYDFIGQVRALIERLAPHLELICGNVATGAAVVRTAAAGAKGVKVGVGPGAVCITRVQTGHGVPQLTVVEEGRNALDRHGYDDVLLIADGGLDMPGSLVGALRAGADFGMMGTPFVRTHESSPEIESFGQEGKERIWHAGNASGDVQLDPPPVPNETDLHVYRRTQGPRREGDCFYINMIGEYRTVRGALVYYTDGLTSGVSYAGGDNLAELAEYGTAQRQSLAGLQEGKARLRNGT